MPRKPEPPEPWFLQDLNEIRSYLQTNYIEYQCLAAQHTDHSVTHIWGTVAEDGAFHYLITKIFGTNKGTTWLETKLERYSTKHSTQQL